MDAHGAWLDTSAVSAITGARSFFASSVRWSVDSVYWSGIVAKLKRGPRYPRFRLS